jgi:putative ABC transport system permease protein
MNTLMVKALRDLWRSRALFITIIALLALGVGIYVTMYPSFLNIERSENFAYEELNFADAFYYASPAIPSRSVDWIEDVDGVAAAEGRYVENVIIHQPDDHNTLLPARIISLPDDETPQINQILIRDGEYLPEGNGRYALVDSFFADFYGLKPGDSLSLSYQGVDRDFKIRGAFTSPEYLWKSQGSAEIISSPGDFAVLMVRRNAVDEMLGVEGLINEITVRFESDADKDVLFAEIDRYLDRYGSHQLVKKEDQLSYALLKADIDGFGEMAVAVPVIFLFITALVAYSMLTRMVQSQRPIIGLMRAEGFSRAQILIHYLTFPLLIAVIGGGLGLIWGTFAASALTSFYIGFLDLPFTIINSHIWVLAVAFVTGLIACIIAGIQPALAAAGLTPSEAMRTDTSAGGGASALERIIPMKRLPNMLRLAVRNMLRGRWRTLSSIAGIALSVAMVTAVMGMLDTMDNAFDVQFGEIQQHDLKVLFNQNVNYQRTETFESWPQVRKAEPIAEIPVKFINGEHTTNSLITAVEENGTLLKPRYVAGVQPLSSDGIFLTETLADDLNVKLGDTIQVEYQKRTETFPIVGLVSFPMSESAYMRLSQASILLRGSYATSGLVKLEDLSYTDEVTDMLELRPYVLAVERSGEIRETFQEYMELTNQFIGIMVVFGMSLAAFAVFNTVTLNVIERSRELATMRTLGFSKWQVNMLLTLETMVTGIIGILVGFVLGYIIESYLMRQMASLDWNMDIFISPVTFLTVGLLTIVVLLISEVPGLRSLHRKNLAEATKELAS